MNKKNFISIAVLAVLVILFIVTKMDNNTERIINFFEADSAEVTGFKLQTLNDTIRLAKEGDTWMITSPVKYPATPRKIESLFNKVLTAETSSEPVSVEVSSRQKYNITDSLGTIFTVYGKDDKVLEEVVFGKSKSGSNTPVRKRDSNKIYRLEANLSYNLKADLMNWRQREIAKIESAAIEKISVVFGNEGYELTASDSMWTYMDGKSQLSLELNNSVLVTLQNSLRNVVASDFYDEDKEIYLEKLQNPVMEIAVSLKDGEKYYFRIAEAEETKLVLQMNNSNEYLYQIRDSWIKSFQKSAADFKLKQ